MELTGYLPCHRNQMWTLNFEEFVPDPSFVQNPNIISNIVDYFDWHWRDGVWSDQDENPCIPLTDDQLRLRQTTLFEGYPGEWEDHKWGLFYTSQYN